MGGGDLDRLERLGNHHNPKILSLIRDRLTRKPARVAKRLTEEEAYAVESDLIRQYGRKDLGRMELLKTLPMAALAHRT